MKTQNTFLRAGAIAAFALVIMLGTHGFSQGGVESSEFVLIENYPNGLGPVIDLNQRAAANDPTTTIGSYELYFHRWIGGVLEPVSTLPVMSAELILRAYVYDAASGVPAEYGTAVFEYCSYKGRPPNDIERADEAPKEACDAGIATWKRLRSVDLNASSCPGFGLGNACMNFGIVSIPRDVGFRFRFSAKRSPIGPGISDAANFTWTAPL